MPIDPSLRTALRALEILIVEDDPDTQESLRVLLEHCGARVTCASSAFEALQFVTARPRYHVLISDLEMPGRSGMWLVSELRRTSSPEKRAFWAILLTGSATQDIEGEAKRAGFDICLKKPVNTNSLLRAIARLGG